MGKYIFDLVHPFDLPISIKCILEVCIFLIFICLHTCLNNCDLRLILMCSTKALATVAAFWSGSGTVSSYFFKWSWKVNKYLLPLSDVTSSPTLFIDVNSHGFDVDVNRCTSTRVEILFSYSVCPFSGWANKTSLLRSGTSWMSWQRAVVEILKNFIYIGPRYH